MVRIQTEDFDVSTELTALRVDMPGVGAVASFVGCVRDRNDGQGVGCLELEHYPGMTERSLETIACDAFDRFDVVGVSIIHRVGRLAPTDQIVFVAASSAHRGESFKACEFLMDYLKTQAPFWKKEDVVEQGRVTASRWVDARVSDDQAMARWSTPA